METYYATPVEMAENLCINPLTIYAWVFSGKLRAKQEGNDNLIENNDFINFISSLSDKEKRQADIFQDLYCHLSKLYSGIDGAAENNRASYINKINAEALKIMKKNSKLFKEEFLLMKSLLPYYANAFKEYEKYLEL